jgi:hypothetical protein
MPAPKDITKRAEWIRKNREWHKGKISTKRNGKIKQCIFCNKEFYVAKHKMNTKKYCSKDCYTKCSNNTLIKKCEKCGKEFKSYGSNHRQYCSRKCGYNSETITCVCGKVFTRGVSLHRKYCSRECRDKIVKHRGKDNGMWKGKDASYSAFHHRLTTLRGKPACCEQCGETNPNKRYEWANLTGQFDNPEDYKRLCVRCHRILDGTLPYQNKKRAYG